MVSCHQAPLYNNLKKKTPKLHPPPWSPNLASISFLPLPFLTLLCLLHSLCSVLFQILKILKVRVSCGKLPLVEDGSVAGSPSCNHLINTPVYEKIHRSKRKDFPIVLEVSKGKRKTEGFSPVINII